MIVLDFIKRCFRGLTGLRVNGKKTRLLLIFLAVWFYMGQTLPAEEKEIALESISETERLLNMTLEELTQVKITSGSLTKTDRKLTPASVTYISQQDIIESGARRLDELLDIMVPNLQIVRHNYGPSHVGVRGLINDRENSYLYVVNGKALNQKGHAGVIMERDLPMLGDIKSI